MTQKFITMIVLIGIIPSAFAFVMPNRPVLNQVQLQLSAQQWVSTKTARVIVEVNATTNASGLVNMQQQIMTNLRHIASPANWHITLLQRSKDQSGLLKVHVLAQARLPETALAELSKKATRVSKQGEKYTIADVEFVPSFAAFEQARQVLRTKIYAQANAELTVLNKKFPQQRFVVHQINFNQVPLPRPMIRTTMLAAMPNAKQAAVAVSNRLHLTARVVLAASRATRKP